MRTTTLLALLPLLLPIACTDEPAEDGPTSGASTSDGPTSGSTTAVADTGEATDPDGTTVAPGSTGPIDPDTGTTTEVDPTTTGEPTAGETTTGGVVEELPPTDSAELLPWLEAGEYLGWAAESAVHQSTGPHGMVRTFFNQTLVDSYEDGLAAHPQGSATVKELYTAGGQPNGWAVMVKVQPDSAGGDGWYWYELLGETVFADGTGVGLCTGCHSGGGVDYVLTPWPLQ